MNNEINPSIIFFGTSDFAVPALKALVKNDYRVVAVVTRPDERIGRKQILTPPAIKVAAQRHGIPVFQPKKLEIGTWNLEMPQADLFVVAAYGKILPKEILNMPRLGCLNIHPSLLPRWRGPSPIQYAILRGDVETGVTIIKLDEEMDHGPILARSPFPVPRSPFTYPKLHDRLAKLGADLLIETIPRWLNHEITPTAQDDAKAAYSKILTRDDGRIDWRKPADEIERMTRAFDPWPGAWTLWSTETKILRVRIGKSDAIDEQAAAGGPGVVGTEKKYPILIKTGEGSLAVQRIGIEGKKTIDADSFLRGYPQVIGTSFV